MMSDKKKIPFIGRQDELDQILSLAKETKTRKVLFIEGDGGVGKTALLNQAYKEVKKISNNALLVTEIIDFDDRSVLIPDNLRQKIAQMLGWQAFKEFHQEWNHLRETEKAGGSQEEILLKKEKVRKVFVDNFNKITQDTRVVIFFDTTDSLPSTPVWDRLRKIIIDAKNTVFILAGRTSLRLLETLEPELGKAVAKRSLSPMTVEDSLVYLQEKIEIVQLNISDEIAKKILYLAHGRPILIDLTVEWLSRKISLDWLNEVDPSPYRNISEKEKKSFEQNLVSHIIDLRHPIDQLSLILSRIYPLDLEGVTKFFDRPNDLYQLSLELVFIKTLPDHSISLHDEMRRMINEHIWPRIDKDGGRRRRDSEIALNLIDEKMAYYKDRIKNIETSGQHLFHGELRIQEHQSQLEVLRKQMIEHYTFINILDDFSLYINAVKKSRLEYDFVFAKDLTDSVESLYDFFEEGQKYQFDLLKGRILYDLSRNDEAQQLFTRLLAEQKGDKRRTAEIYNGLAVSEMKLGNLENAKEFQLKCLALFEELNENQSIPFVANQVGLIYSEMGDLSNAIKYFKQAFEKAASLDQNESTSDLMAGILNYWGYACGQQNNFEEAIHYCTRAIEIWSRLNLESKVARGEALLGAVYRIKGDFALAEEYLEKAIEHFKTPSDNQRLVKAYSELGFTYHIMGTDPAQFIKARAYLESGVRLAEAEKEKLELPLLLSRLSRLYWLFVQHPGGLTNEEVDKYKKKARKTNDDAYQKALEIKDVYTLVKCVLGKAEFDIEDEEASKDKIPEYAAEFEKLLKEYDWFFPLFSGRMNRIQAELAFENGEYDKALDFYAKGLAQIDEHGGYGVYSIEQELEKLAEKLDRLPNDKAKEWLDNLKKVWSNEPEKGEKPHIFLISWCIEQSLKQRPTTQQ